MLRMVTYSTATVTLFNSFASLQSPPLPSLFFQFYFLFSLFSSFPRKWKRWRVEGTACLLSKSVDSVTLFYSQDRHISISFHAVTGSVWNVCHQEPKKLFLVIKINWSKNSSPRTFWFHFYSPSISYLPSYLLSPSYLLPFPFTSFFPSYLIYLPSSSLFSYLACLWLFCPQNLLSYINLLLYFRLNSKNLNKYTIYNFSNE